MIRERMKTHALDGFSLVAGLLFVALGVLVAIDASPGRDVDPRWMVAVLLVGLGLAGVLGSLDWSRRAGDSGGGDQPESPVPPTPPSSEEEPQP